MPTETLPCAYCRQHPATAEFLPFCCDRCKMADLGRWLTGGYRLAGSPSEPLDSRGDEDDHGDTPDGREP